MKTVKILIATAILCTSFYACKKEEMNIKSNDVGYKSASQNKMASEFTTEAETDLNSDGIVKIVFNKIGSMLVKGNPSLQKALNIYNATSTAIASAREVFASTDSEELSIVFDRNGYVTESNIPDYPKGASFDAFLTDFCKLKLSNESMLFTITRNDVVKNYQEFWDAMPIGMLENLQQNTEKIQSYIPAGYVLNITVSPAQQVNVTLLDNLGNPQPTVSGGTGCVGTNGGGSNSSNWGSFCAYFSCMGESWWY